MQQAAVRELTACGYLLRYDFQVARGDLPRLATHEPVDRQHKQLARSLLLTVTAPPPAAWPMSLLPFDMRHSVVSAQPGRESDLKAASLAKLHGLQRLFLHDKTVSSDDWRTISQLDDLEVLFVSRISMDAPALQCVSGLKGLTYLALRDGELDVKALPSAISDHRQLESLDLSFSTVSGDAFRQVNGLFRLVALSLEGTGLTDEGLAHVAASLPHLERLDLSKTLISDRGCTHLAKLEKLQTLILQDVAIDAGLERLGALQHLRHLDLSYSDASDSGVAHLLGLKSLRWLNVRGPHVTDGMVKQLRERLPACQVIN
ncbi:leucine-rich repeat domain-containing protein [Pirellulimonas nuda]|uniref:leucine-rich repeat domain-containing protein n=1 Tax=Pirellulimonas nuda TaxID=2528009 RepID=UPI0018D2A34C|nr:hypothetical protein [Pirellulimonas nuda]